MSHPLLHARPVPATGLPFILLAAVLWGTIAITVEALYRLTPLTPLQVGFLRVALAAPALLLLAVRTGPHPQFRADRAFLSRSALIGLAVASDQVCNFTAIQTVGVSTASLVSLCTAPLLVAVFGALIWREPVSKPVYALLAAALVGTALLVVHPHTTGGPSVQGVLWALGSAASYATIILTSRSLARRAPPLVTLASAFTLATVLLLPLAARAGIPALPPAAWGLLAYLGLIATGVAYLLFLLGLRHTPATIASVVTLLEPFLAALLAAILFGERLSRLGLLGGGILLTALALLPLALKSGGSPHVHPPETHR